MQKKRYMLIIHKIDIINLNIFFYMKKQLMKIRNIIKKNIVIFIKLLIIIFTIDFYLFSLIIHYLIYNNRYLTKNYYRKIFKKSFDAIIFLIQQIC